MNRQSADNQIEQIYLENNSIIETAKALQLPYKKVHNYLVNHTSYVSKRKKPVKTSTYNKDYFTTIDSADKAYFAGLIKADGYIDKARNRVAIRLQEKDIELLEKFCDVLGFSHSRLNRISPRRDGQSTHVEFSLTNEQLVSPLLDIKSKEFLIKVPDEFAFDFIRGYFDGDGSISYRNLKKLHFAISIMGSPNDSSMLEYIMDKIPGFTKIYMDKRSSLPFIQSQNQQTIRTFRDLIYNKCTLYLTRKKTKFDQFSLLFDVSTTTRKAS
jgi:hypothetical protein